MTDSDERGGTTGQSTMSDEPHEIRSACATTQANRVQSAGAYWDAVPNEGSDDMGVLIVLGGLALVAVLIVVWLIGIYNALVGLRNTVKTAWADIDAELQRRYDLIPNLVETVKGYASHEKETFENITKARSAAMNAQGPAAKGVAEGLLGQMMGQLRVVVENYPELKANENFLSLQNDLAETEDRMNRARQAYNGDVLQLNNKVEMFPSNIVAGMFNFDQAEFFEIADEEVREAPKVSF
jgi:LemA protein